jgi:hypothetical protein
VASAFAGPEGRRAVESSSGNASSAGGGVLRAGETKPQTRARVGKVPSRVGAGPEPCTPTTRPSSMNDEGACRSRRGSRSVREADACVYYLARGRTRCVRSRTVCMGLWACVLHVHVLVHCA